MGSPYAETAGHYWAAGWRGVLPLPHNAKSPVPRGFTGWAGADPSWADVQAWIDGGVGRYPAGNIALRLPRGVYGLDVDAWGAKTGAAALNALTSSLGPLPPTVCVSSRDDGVSGIRLYRGDPGPGRRWRDEPGGHGAGIEAIHFGHRYAVTWPSIHPDTGAKYVFRGTDGAHVDLDEIPAPGLLPELPPAWVAGISEPGEVRSGDMAGHAESVEVVAGWPLGQPCRRTVDARDRGMRALVMAGDGAALHPSGRDAVHELANLGNEGHRGCRAALAEHFDVFVEVRTARGMSRNEAAAEWWRLVRGAVGKLIAGNRRDHCDCDVWAGVGLDWAPDSWPAVPQSSPPTAPAPPFCEETSVAAPSDWLDDPGPSAALVELEAPVQLVTLPPAGSPLEALKREFVTAGAMGRRRAPQPIVSGLLYRDTLAWIIGKSGSFKSFVTLDIGAAVAADRPWAGRRVWGGVVVYVVAEGAGGMPLRVRAWEKLHGPMPENLIMLPRAVQIAGAGWPVLIEALAELRPVLTIIDTQARSSVGIKENDNTDIGVMIDRLDMMRRATGSCVWTVHHIGRAGEDARGGSALDGAQDTELKIERVGGMRSMTAVLKVDKQKDAADTLEVPLAATVVELGVDEHTGEALSSLVVAPDMLADPFQPAPWRDGIVENQVVILDILRELFSEQGGTRADVRAALRERRLRDSRWINNQFGNAWNALLEKDLIERVGTSQRFVIVELNATVKIDDGRPMPVTDSITQDQT